MLYVKLLTALTISFKTENVAKEPLQFSSTKKDPLQKVKLNINFKFRYDLNCWETAVSQVHVSSPHFLLIMMSIYGKVLL